MVKGITESPKVVYVSIILFSFYIFSLLIFILCALLSRGFRHNLWISSILHSGDGSVSIHCPHYLFCSGHHFERNGGWHRPSVHTKGDSSETFSGLLNILDVSVFSPPRPHGLAGGWDADLLLPGPLIWQPHRLQLLQPCQQQLHQVRTVRSLKPVTLRKRAKESKRGRGLRGCALGFLRGACI